MIKVTLLVAASVMVPGFAQADIRDDVMSAMQRCSIIKDDRVWLDCTYGAQQIMRARLGLAPAPEYQQRLVPPSPNYPQRPMRAAPVPNPAVASMAAPAPVSPPPVKRRGSIMQELTGSAPPVTVSTLTDVRFDGGGAFTVTLANGQVWRQADDGTGTKPRFKPGTTITITPGALWSYNLKADGITHVYKVNRKA